MKSTISITAVVDKVCTQDILFQAVEQIGHDSLRDQYAASDYFVEVASDRVQLAAR